MLFQNMTPSEHAESIYYSDLFRINGKVWALTGTGKSSAGRAASLRLADDDIARDCVAFIRDKDVLMARYDPGALNTSLLDTLHKPHPLAAVVYCLSESETAKAYAGKALKLVPETPENIGWLLSKSMYPAPLAPHFFDDSAQHRLYDERRRIQQWMRLTHGVKGVCWLVAPWMPTDAEKGDLYKQFVP